MPARPSHRILAPGRRKLLNCVAAPAGLLLGLAASAAPPGVFNRHIAVDQFGYLPDMAKVAVIGDPQRGFNARHRYSPGPRFEVRTWPANTVVFSNAPVAWNNGAIHDQSGDRVWWFDFSTLTNAGEYYVYDPRNDTRSARFHIGADVYAGVLKQAVRMFYYQRRGAAKERPYAGARWTDKTNFLGPLQDSHCRLVTRPDPDTERDLRGGWFDAGDYNKYVNFTTVPLSDLLFAYQLNPAIWPDNYDIPESGNNIPDLLDEVKWEMDWLLRMQNPNGSVLSKMGVSGYQNASPPSSEKAQVFYGAESTTATLSAAGSFAQASPAFGNAGMKSYAATLSNAAVTAYTWAAANPAVRFQNTGFASADPEAEPANYEYERDGLRLRAAVFLYELTGQASYRTWAESACQDRRALSKNSWNVYDTPAQDALLRFSTLPGISPATASAIRRSKQISMEGPEWLGAWTSQRDAYRAFLIDDSYHWGSSSIKCRTGQLFAAQVDYRIDPDRVQDYREAAAAYLHYMHGVNPLTFVFLSNMGAFGVEASANAMYHGWFAHGTIYENAQHSPNGPAPGYVTGGPNKNYRPATAYSGPRLSPPLGQPPQKSYKDWGVGWPEDSWEITEPAIYYQGDYVLLLSRFVSPPPATRAAHP
ncbi:MAG: glycoside hydrolase family 9 protein [Verrucomicrobiota bacterium]